MKTRSPTATQMLAGMRVLFRGRRKALGLKQRELAERAGTTVDRISDFENGHGSPCGVFLAACAAVLELELLFVPNERPFAITTKRNDYDIEREAA